MKTRALSNVQSAPPLGSMHDVYGMSREHGCTSEEFARCEYHNSITRAISVRSKGLSADRVTPEIDDRLSDKPCRARYRIVNLCSREKDLQGDAICVLGDTHTVSDTAAVLLGDDVTNEMGGAPLGIPNSVGYRWAVARAQRTLTNVDRAAALRATIAH